MKENPLVKLSTFGQSIWLDYIRRQMIDSGELKKFIDEDGLKGVTSNPAIFEKAIAGSGDYNADIRKLAQAGKSIQEIYETLTVADVGRAADEFRAMYDQLDGQDGFVSLEVNPHLAHDTGGTIAEARRLWHALNRPNVLIKVPATQEGLPAIRQLISEGINVNVTLLFGLPRYKEVADAYISGLEARAAQGQPLNRVASVASFFLSRIDVLLDPQLEKLAAAGGAQGKTAQELVGQIAIASAKIAYLIYQEIFGSERFRRLAALGARPQRLLWASTSTKNPAYADVKYVEPLIGPETVNTLPLETLEAYRDHGHPASRLSEDVDRAASYLQRLPELGLDLNQATQQLEDEGVEKFNKPFDSLMCTLEGKRREAVGDPLDQQTVSLGAYEGEVQRRLERMAKEDFGARLWRKDPSLWKQDPEDQKGIPEALGWLGVADTMTARVAELCAFAQEVRQAGIRHVVHMGMGGSSLAPLALLRTFGVGPDGLPLTVLDTTEPATIKSLENAVPLNDTLFIVASKSGTTAEPLAFMDYFYDKVKARKGGQAGENFVAITDPGTPLTQTAQERSFRKTFLNFPDIGGRYSALSYFGLVPAVLLGIEVAAFLSQARSMMHACGPGVPVKDNPGLVLGAILGVLAQQGRDKVTFVAPEVMASLGMWLEQLLAESTGKEGTGLVPVAGERVGPPSVYGHDRVFVYFRLAHEEEDQQEKAVAALKQAGQPVITIQMANRMDMAQEFFRWEIATAAAGAVLGINPFNQPNVQESKDNTNRLLKVVAEKGQLPEERQSLAEGPVSLFVEAGEAAPTVGDTLRRFLGQAKPGDYVALLAYLTEGPDVELALEDLRHTFRDRLHLATTVGYGPRYLHSTGQLHKGGANTGIFVELTSTNQEELPVPGRPYTFGVLQQAQALGDLESLRQHGRRVMRVHLREEVPHALSTLRFYLESALPEITS
jgi:transaldolase/glucose-6-phosphate isomerase